MAIFPDEKESEDSGDFDKKLDNQKFEGLSFYIKISNLPTRTHVEKTSF